MKTFVIRKKFLKLCLTLIEFILETGSKVGLLKTKTKKGTGKVFSTNSPDYNLILDI